MLRTQTAVAGTTVPAFVERRARSWTAGTATSLAVAGTTVPAFVERFGTIEDAEQVAVLSPGLRSRPSLSAPRPAVRSGALLPGCRRDYGPGLR